MSARIERLIGLASLQGKPVTGYRSFGVPPGGAFDQESYALGNALVGNDPGALSIELSNAAIEIAFSSATRVSVTGAAVERANTCFEVSPGQILPIRAPTSGLRVYLAVAGGWIPEGIDSILGRSGRKLTAGDVLSHAETTSGGQLRRLEAQPLSLAPSPIRVIGAPRMTLRVSNDSDRTGVRLDGLAPHADPELPSEPVCPGVVQRTPSGQLIVIGPDGPTIGGYPKIGYVCSADLDRLAQLRPGQEVSFEPVSLDEARRIAAEQADALARKIALLRLA